MTDTTYPSQIVKHRRADMVVHGVGLILIAIASALLISKAQGLQLTLLLAVIVYALCALASNVASWGYHFLPLHDRRTLLRRIDHAAIYPSITGTFTPFFIIADTNWAMTLLWVCWALTAVAMWKKITDDTVKSKWSTASYLGLGALGLCAIPDLTDVPITTLWCILAGAASYVVGTVFYARRTMAFRYAIWHSFVNLGGAFMFVGVWLAL